MPKPCTVSVVDAANSNRKRFAGVCLTEWMMGRRVVESGVVEGMSGVYIKGIKMPRTCYDDCPCQGIHWCNPLNESTEPMTGKRLDNCPLIPVPDHGRLGDLDKLESGLRLMAKYQDGDRQQGILGCCETIRLAPTIIPVDREGEA